MKIYLFKNITRADLLHWRLARVSAQLSFFNQFRAFKNNLHSAVLVGVGLDKRKPRQWMNLWKYFWRVIFPLHVELVLFKAQAWVLYQSISAIISTSHMAIYPAPKYDVLLDSPPLKNDQKILTLSSEELTCSRTIPQEFQISYTNQVLQ